ncbi:MAG TPA: tetratricopeptide repeat protein [Opitutaceae bacterium]|nr:tetratricopeptide repeat protein [Opitutaceae bacterium]
MAPSSPPPDSPAGPPSGAPESRRLAVIMFTDMVGYSALTQRDEALALQLLEEHRQIVRPILARHGGREIKTIGDAFLVEFASALAAAAGAVEIQRALHDRNEAAPADRRLQIRIGLHAGDVVYRENDVFGDGVNIAARIEPLAGAGGICLSEDVARQIQNKIGHPLVRLGSGELKNIAMPVAIFRLLLPWQKRRAPAAERLTFLLRKRSVRRALVAAAAAIAVLAWLRLGAPRAAPALPLNRLAVLPLANLGGDATDENFADGMTEELISSLANIRDLNVIARTSVARFKGTQLDIAAIGAALRVGSVLEGSVRMAGDEVRINVHLVDVRTQKTLWSQEYTRLLKDVFAIQSAIASSVTDALQVQLLSGERDRLERRGTASSEAYRQYLAGRAQLNKRTGEEIANAIASFTHATEEDPAFALAFAGLAEGYTLAGNAGFGSLPRDEAIARARTCAQKAIALDGSLAEAHAALGYVNFRIDWDWAAAEAEFKRALELKPGYARAHEWYGLFLAIEKRGDEALAEMRRAQDLDPLSPSVNTGIGRLLHFQRRYDEAVAQFKEVLRLEPDYAEAYFGLGMTYLAARRYDDAIAALQTAIRLSGNRPVMVAILGLTEGRAGRKAEARRIYDDLLKSAATGPFPTYLLGVVSVGLGETDRAFQLFERACAERDGILVYLGVDPILDSLWSDPRYAALMKKIGLPP